MAAAAATSPSSIAIASRPNVPSHSARRGSCRRDRPPAFVAAAASPSSSGRTLSLQLRLPLPSRFSSFVLFARRGKNTSAAVRNGRSKKEKKSLHADDVEEEDTDEDAFEALFSQLEEDLKTDNLSDDGIDAEITEDDLARLEEELANAIGDEDDDDVNGEMSFDSENVDDSDEDEEDYRLPKLKKWQLRRLASALKIGRRKTSIKDLSAELGLDRAVVLDLLREPPPNLLLMAASLPEKVAASLPPEAHDQCKPVEPLPVQTDIAETESKVEAPVHVMKTTWSMNKRLKKVQVETLERVYARSKRPTNAMISNIVHVTNLPWKRVVKWFEDKRIQDGIAEHHLPFRRSERDFVSSE